MDDDRNISTSLETLHGNRLGSAYVPEGSDRRSRRKRKVHDRSRRFRMEGRRKTRSVARVAAATLVTLALAGLAVAGATYALEMWGGRTVPDVIGVVQSGAVESLGEKGFLSVEAVEVPSDSMEGHVVAVDPAPGNRVPESTTIRLSIGVARHMPDVVGMAREEARATLIEAGAENIVFTTREQRDQEDKVLETRPAADAVFMSSDEILVVVSQLPSMIDIAGETQEVAEERLRSEGIPYDLVLERADADQRLKVVRTEPAAGEALAQDKATVVVGDPLIDVLHIADYRDATPVHIQAFLQGEGWESKVGHLSKDGTIVASFVAGDGQTSLAFAEDPWAKGVLSDTTAYTDVMGDEGSVDGVRLTVPAEGTAVRDRISELSVGETCAREVMELCGLENLEDSCTRASIRLPKGARQAANDFYCCSGEMGHNVWTVLIEGTTETGASGVGKIVVTCAPGSTYGKIDLTVFDNRACDFVAYQEEFV